MLYLYVMVLYRPHQPVIAINRSRAVTHTQHTCHHASQPGCCSDSLSLYRHMEQRFYWRPQGALRAPIKSLIWSMLVLRYGREFSLLVVRLFYAARLSCPASSRPIEGSGGIPRYLPYGATVGDDVTHIQGSWTKN